MAEHEVVWWEIESPDPDRTQGFYRALFGWGFRRAFDEPDSELGRRYWIVERGGVGIGGLQESQPTLSPAHAAVRLYVEVDDLEATLSRAVELGATSERGRHPRNRRLLVRERARSHGDLTGLWTRRPPPN